MRLTLGFTASDRDRKRGSSSFTDGYRPGAAQERYDIEVSGAHELTGPQWAEAVFTATNTPDEVVADTPPAMAVRAAITTLLLDGHGSRVRIRSLSIGDTVTAAGARYTCAQLGRDEAPS
jgi:hypothetical protein